MKMKGGSSDGSGSNKSDREKSTGAIIPGLMHRIPSELRSELCLGENSTKIGDLLGSPRVATPLFAIFSPATLLTRLPKLHPLYYMHNDGGKPRGWVFSSKM